MTGVAQAVTMQARIVFYVAARDVQVRHRVSPLGILSAIVEPLATICMLALIMSQIRMRVPQMGDFLILFLMTAVLPVSLFRGAVNSVDKAMGMMRRTLLVPQIVPLDLIIGTLLVHFFIILTLFLGFTLFFVLVMRADMPENLIICIIPCICNTILGFGVGVLNLTIKSWFPLYGLIYGIVTAPLGLMSGLFYTAETMPEAIQRILYWNPLMHSTEFTRTYFFPEFESGFFDPSYYFGWVLTTLCIGLYFERRFRHRIAKPPA